MSGLPSELQSPTGVSPNAPQLDPINPTPHPTQEVSQLSESELAWQRHVAEAQHALQRQAMAQENFHNLTHTVKSVQRVWGIVSLIGFIFIILLLIGLQFLGQFIRPT